MRKSLISKMMLLFAICLVVTLSRAVVAIAAELPSVYGIYLLQGEKIISLEQGNLQFRTALTIGDIKSGAYGIPAPPYIKVDPAPVEIIFFDPEISPKKVRLSKLEYIKAVPAHRFDIKKEKTDRRFFRSIYGVSYSKPIPINLYCAEGDIPLSIGPVEQKHGMYRLIPQRTLQPGIYSVNFGSVTGPQYYIGNLKFYPFVYGEIKKAPQATMESRPQRILPKSCFISQLYE